MAKVLRKYKVKKKFENCRVHSELGVFVLNSKISQAKLKLLYENGHHDKVDYD